MNLNRLPAVLGIPTAILFLALISSCNSRVDKMEGGSGFSAQDLSSFQTLQSNIFAPECLQCHSGSGASGGVDLSSYSSIMANAGLVKAGDPSSSLLYQEVASGDMPLNGNPLAPVELESIQNWILAGAPNGEFSNPAGGVNPTPSPTAAPTAAPTPTPTPVAASPTFSEVESKIFAQSCTRCHSGSSPSAGINLSSYASIMSDSGLIVSGSPSSSRIYTEIESGSMPPSGSKVSSALLQTLQEWIDSGAKND